MATQLGDYAMYQHHNQYQLPEIEAQTQDTQQNHIPNGGIAYTSLPGPTPPPVSHTEPTSYQGRKRRTPEDTEDEVESRTHISKQFKKLRLHHSTPQVTPINGLRPHLDTHEQTHPYDQAHLQYGRQPRYHYPPPFPHTSGEPDMELMPIDDGADRVIITDLDAEIAAIEAEEASNASMLLPDFDKQVSDIHYLLNNDTKTVSYEHNTNVGPSSSSQALILYRDPSSITVPESEDVVRKAIVEARKRARQKVAEGAPQVREPGREEVMKLKEDERGQHNTAGAEEEDYFDEDAMDIG